MSCLKTSVSFLISTSLLRLFCPPEAKEKKVSFWANASVFLHYLPWPSPSLYIAGCTRWSQMTFFLLMHTCTYFVHVCEWEMVPVAKDNFQNQFFPSTSGSQRLNSGHQDSMANPICNLTGPTWFLIIKTSYIRSHLSSPMTQGLSSIYKWIQWLFWKVKCFKVSKSGVLASKSIAAS